MLQVATRRRLDQQVVGRGPWEHQDPWSAGRARGRDIQAPALEDAFMQFLQWRAQVAAGANGSFAGQQDGSTGASLQAARDGQEKATAGPPPEWDDVAAKLKARIWLQTTRTPARARGPLLLLLLLFLLFLFLFSLWFLFLFLLLLLMMMMMMLMLLLLLVVAAVVVVVGNPSKRPGEDLKCLASDED